MKPYELTLTEAARLLATKELSSRELTQSCIERIKAVEPKIHAFTTQTPELALEMADKVDAKRAAGESLSPLAGIPAGIKDCISTRGTRTTASSKMLENYIPPYDACVIEKLTENDYVMLGKTNLDEFAMGSSTENSAFGASHNPWDINRVPGGSSGGSAACVAAGEALYALGSDTGGSIRQPASFCGVVGLKPTYGTVSRYGLLAFASSLDQIGPIGKTVEDCTLVFNAIAGNDHRDSTSAVMDYPNYLDGIKQDIRGKRIGIPKEYFAAGMRDDVRAVFEKNIETMRALGATVEETTLPTFDSALSAYYIISSAEVTSNLSRYDGVRYGYRSSDHENIRDMIKKSRSQGFGAEAKRRMLLGNYVLSSGYYDAYYLKALRVRTLIKQDFERVLSEFDYIISPVVATPAFKLGEITSPMEMYASDIFTVPVNIAGMCAVSLPGGLSREGLPVGLQIIGKPFTEREILRAAYNFETATGFCAKPEL